MARLTPRQERIREQLTPEQRSRAKFASAEAVAPTQEIQTLINKATNLEELQTVLSLANSRLSKGSSLTPDEIARIEKSPTKTFSPRFINQFQLPSDFQTVSRPGSSESTFKGVGIEYSKQADPRRNFERVLKDVGESLPVIDSRKPEIRRLREIEQGIKSEAEQIGVENAISDTAFDQLANQTTEKIQRGLTRSGQEITPENQTSGVTDFLRNLGVVSDLAGATGIGARTINELLAQQQKTSTAKRKSPQLTVDERVIKMRAQAQQAIDNGVNPDVANKFAASSLRNLAIQELQKAGVARTGNPNEFINEQNIQAAMQQLQGEPPTPTAGLA